MLNINLLFYYILDKKIICDLPPICTELGTIPRNEILINYLASIEHIECIKVENMKNLSISEVNINAPLNKLVLKQN